MKQLKKRKKLIASIFSIISLCIAIYFAINIIFSPYWNSVYAPSGYLSFKSMRYAESDKSVYTKSEAEEDLDYIISCLKRVHPAFKDEVPKNVRICLDNEKNSFGENVTTYELWRAAARLLNSTGDADNIVAPSFSTHFLTDYLQKLNNGYEIVEINGNTIDEIFEKNYNLFSYELDAWGKNALKNCFQTLEGLTFIGFDCDNLEFTYSNLKGSTVTEKYSKKDFVDYETAASIIIKETEDTPSYSTTINKEGDFGIITIDNCEFSTEFKEFLYSFFNDVIENNITNVVVDLRNNNGGTSQVADEFMMYLTADSFRTPSGSWRLGPCMMNWKSEKQTVKHYDETQFDGNVYVLTSSKTFSSATFFADIIQANGLGKIVGEPCGNKPDCYDDPVVFQTPNAIMSFQISSKHYDRIDTFKADEPLIPDIECSANEALEKVISIIGIE